MIQKLLGTACCAIVAGSMLVGEVQARPNYVTAMKDQYPNIAEQIATNKCTVCHFGTKKTDRNDYGAAMATALGEKNVKDADKLKAALKKIESEKSKTEGKTFGDQIKDGKLPGTNPE